MAGEAGGTETKNEVAPTADHEDVQAPVVGRITKAVVKYPVLCSLWWLTVAIIFSAIGLVTIGGEADNLFQALGAPEFRPLENNIIQREQALTELQAARYRAGEEQDEEEEEDPDREEDQRSSRLDTTTILYEDLVGDNLLTKEVVDKMVTVENAFMSVEWEERCLLVYSANENKTDESRCASPTTILNYLFRNNDKHKELCEDGFCVMPYALVPFCSDWGTPPCVSNAYDWRDGELADEEDWPKLIEDRLCKANVFDSRSILDAGAWECGELDEDVTSAYLRSFYSTGFPIPGYKNTDNRTQQANELSPIIFGNPPDRYGVKRRRALAEAIDPLSATSSEANVYVGRKRGDKTVNIIWNDFFGLTGKFGDVLFLDLLYAMASLTFVFCYIWANVGSITIALAGITEIVLSLPMALTFWRVFMQQERVDFLFFLSVYIILCIGADDIFVFYDSWRASASAPPAISGSLETRLSWTYKQAATAMLTTTSTTVLCLLLTTTSSLPSLRSFGIFVALVVLFDYLLVITWLPCVVVSYTTYIEKWCPSCGPCCRAPKQGENDAVPERRSVIFLRERVSPFMFKYRHAFLALSAAIAVSMVVTLGVEFETAEDTPFFIVPRHPFSVFDEISRIEFYSPTAGDYQITVMYGLNKEKPFSFMQPGARQINPFSVEDVETKVEYDSSFNLGPELQEKLVEDCEKAKTYKVGGLGTRKDLIVDEEEVYCLLNDLKAWKSGDFPYADEEKLLKGLKDFYAQELPNRVSEYSDYAALTGFVADGSKGIKALWNSFNTTIPVNTKTGAVTLRPYFEAWEQYQDEQCSSPCLQYLPTSRFNGANWTLYAILIGLAGETITTIGASIACAFVVLLVATQNWWTSLMVIVTIIGAIASMLACIFASGLTFGPNEALYTVLTIGLSIDYAVHMAHFYEHSAGTRYEKAQASMAKIALSVAGGAATTVFAGLPLFGCNGLGLYLFGFFIFFTSFWAFVMTFTFLLPAFMTFGPEGTQGKYLLYFKKQGPNEGGNQARIEPSNSFQRVRTPE